MSELQLRDVLEADVPIFFQHQLDPEANRMAAFTAPDPNDREAFMARWTRLLSDESVTKKTVLCDGQVVGHVASFERLGEPEVTYWIGREHWGRGLATRALTEFLSGFARRPLYARAARDNVASIRVLEKCGFRVTSHELGFANARGEEIEEVVLELS